MYAEAPYFPLQGTVLQPYETLVAQVTNYAKTMNSGIQTMLSLGTITVFIK